MICDLQMLFDSIIQKQRELIRVIPLHSIAEFLNSDIILVVTINLWYFTIPVCLYLAD